MLKPVPSRSTRLEIFDLHISGGARELLVNVVKARLVAGSRKNTCRPSPPRHQRSLSFEKFYTLPVLLESTCGNDSRSGTGHFQAIKQKCGVVFGLGPGRFQEGMACLLLLT